MGLEEAETWRPAAGWRSLGQAQPPAWWKASRHPHRWMKAFPGPLLSGLKALVEKKAQQRWKRRKLHGPVLVSGQEQAQTARPGAGWRSLSQAQPLAWCSASRHAYRWMKALPWTLVPELKGLERKKAQQGRKGQKLHAPVLVAKL